MKKTLPQLLLSCLLLLCLSVSLQAQINLGSPIPVDFEVLEPAGISGSYNYGTQAETWGPQLAQTVSGPLAWAYDIQGDSLCCDSIVTDLTGKVALIRRGECFFGQKAWQAQKAGAIGLVILNHYTTAADVATTVYNMSQPDTEPWMSLALEVTIPAVFISREDGEKIVPAMDAGSEVVVSYTVQPFGGALHAYSFHTPVTGILPLQHMGVSFLNTNADILPSIDVSVDITDPNGVVTTLTENLTDVPEFTLTDIVFSQAYTPAAIGEYDVHFYNSLTPDVIDRKFVITQDVYAMDDNNVVENTNGTIEPNDTAFSGSYQFRYHFGNFYRTGSLPQMATHASFMISNPNELYTGVASADVFKLSLYDADPDGNGSVPSPTTATSYDILDESGGDVEPIATAEYVLPSGDSLALAFKHLIAEFDQPVELEPNKIYLLMAEYDGTEAASSKPPKYAFGGTEDMAGGLSSAVFGSTFNTEGWPGFNAMVRLYIDNPSGTEDLSPLDASKISLQPVPATEQVTLTLDLDKVAEQVEARIVDINGQVLRTMSWDNVQEGSFTINVKELKAGNYFLSVRTPEGFRSKLFQKI